MKVGRVTDFDALLVSRRLQAGLPASFPAPGETVETGEGFACHKPETEKEERS